MFDFKLMPRLKNIGSAQLYRPTAGQDDQWPNLDPLLSTKTIDWDLIAQQCAAGGRPGRRTRAVTDAGA
ncbi:Tn3 family transposase [Streptomyces triculaminicus]|uniref:Tn3 family transposase n=1 Tax=Streptomyces triculaminicus TaxID=2816232 RepID=UPI0037CCC9AB